MKTLRLKVKPGSRDDELSELEDGSWLARVKAPSVDGKANAAVIALVARHCGVRKAQGARQKRYIRSNETGNARGLTIVTTLYTFGRIAIA